MFTLLIYVGYIALWVLLVFLASFISWKLFKSKAVAIIAGLVAFGVMYWPAFGDLIPTLLAHKQLCEKEAGFKVYVTPEQWAEENPGVLENLVPYEKFIEYENFVLGNKRIGSNFNKHIYTIPSIQKKVEVIVDVKSKKVLAESIDFSRGYGRFGSDNFGSIKVWLYANSCYSDGKEDYIIKKRREFFKKLNTKWGN